MGAESSTVNYCEQPGADGEISAELDASANPLEENSISITLNTNVASVFIVWYASLLNKLNH